MLELIDEHKYQTKLGRPKPTEATIITGGQGDKCVPNINASKWNDEVFINLNLSSMIVTNEVEDFTNGLLELKVGDITWRNYLSVSGNGFEIDIEFARRPQSNRIEFDLEFTEGLKFIYQPALTEEEIKGGAYRPDNVCGSYAVYWKEKNNRYKTGKFCHFYAWEATDANGDRQRAGLNLDPVAKKMTIEVDGDWLNHAVYPVYVMGMGDTVGYDTCGGSIKGVIVANRAWFYNVGSPAADGNTDNVGCCFANGIDSSNEIKNILGWDDGASPYPVLDVGAAHYDAASDGACVAWEDTSMSGNSVITSRSYFVGLVAETLTPGTCYDSGGNGCHEDYTFSFADPPADLDSNIVWGDNIHSFWFDYTAAGGISIPVARRRGR